MSAAQNLHSLLISIRHSRYLRSAWFWAALIALALLIGIVVRATRPATDTAGGRPGGGKFGGGPTSVSVAAAEKGSLDIVIDALGTAVPVNQVVVRSRVDGELRQIHFREGQYVQAGDLLAEIDPRLFQVELAQARGRLARDEALLQNAKIDLERYQTLWEQDSISKQEVDTQQALLRQYEGAIVSDRGEVQSAELKLTYARITAPISGRVGLRLIDAGNIVRSGDANGLVQITQLQPITVVFSVPEEKIAEIAEREANAATLAVEAWDRDGRTLIASGKLLTFDSQIDTATGTVKLKAVFDNRGSRVLFPNQFVNVRLQLNTLQDATLIPTTAVQRGSRGLFVYAVQDDQTVKQQAITLGETAGEKVAVTSGVTPGARLVVDGSDKLRDGAKVLVIGAGTAGERGGKGRNGFKSERDAKQERPKAQLTQNKEL